jgi:TonB-dependent SusC/RagA subfamily outer membrane receptor
MFKQILRSNGASNRLMRVLVVGLWLYSYSASLAAAQGVRISGQGPIDENVVRKQAAAVTHVQDTTSRRSQSRLATPVTLEFNNVILSEALEAVAQKAGFRLAYGGYISRSSKRVSLHIKEISAERAVALILEGTGFQYRVLGMDEIVIEPAPTSDSAKKSVVSGIVIDSATRRGIAGATVTIVGTKLSAVTRGDGSFGIAMVPIGKQTITVKILGYTSKSASITVEHGTASRVTFILQQTSTTLSEVVTTATGSRRRVEVANDVAVVNADSLMRIAPVRSVTDLLSVARIPGVEVTPSNGLPGAPSRIRLRGVGSMSQSNDPVVIIDGVRIRSATSTEEIVNRAAATLQLDETTIGGAQAGYVPSRLDDIDPNSIESIEILRGPSASSLYGTDAANGVIVITTKRGQIGATQFSASISHDWNDVPGGYQPIYTGWGKGGLFGYLDQVCNLDNIFALECVQDSVSSFNPKNSPLLTNERSGRTTVYSVSLSGGSRAIQYSINASQREELGPTKIPEVNRIRLRRLNEDVPAALSRPDVQQQTNISTRVTLKPWDSLDIGMSLQATRHGVRHAQDGFRIEMGSSNDEDTLTFAKFPIGYTRILQGSNVATTIIGLTADWRRWTWLMPGLTAGVEQVSRTDRAVQTKRRCLEGECTLPIADLAISQYEQFSYTFRLRIPFVPNFGWNRFLKLGPIMGLDIQKNLSGNTTSSGDSLALGSEDISTASYRNIFHKENNSATAGIYADLNIGVFDRFFTSIGIRRDIGNALSTRIRAPSYPKLGTAWLISDEGFFPQTPWLRTLRLRIAYGHSAIQPDVSAIQGLYLPNQAAVNGVLVSSIALNGYGNFRLKPERAVELEYGIDAGLLDERTQVRLTVSQKRNRNQLVTRGVAPSGGVGAEGGAPYTENVAKVYNRSVELSVDSRLIEHGGTMWSAQMGLSTLINRVERLGDGYTPTGTSDGKIVEGYPLFGQWARPVLAYNDVNRDGILQPQEVVIGNNDIYVGWAHPKYAITYNTAVGLLNGRILINANLTQDVGITQNQNIYTGWGFADPSASLVEQAKARSLRLGNGNVSSNMQTISVLRLTAVSTNFILPAWMTARLKASAASLNIQGFNLGLWTQYQGRDPGVNSSPVGETLQDNGITIPPPRKYSISLRLSY